MRSEGGGEGTLRADGPVAHHRSAHPRPWRHDSPAARRRTPAPIRGAVRVRVRVRVRDMDRGHARCSARAHAVHCVASTSAAEAVPRSTRTYVGRLVFAYLPASKVSIGAAGAEGARGVRGARAGEGRAGAAAEVRIARGELRGARGARAGARGREGRSGRLTGWHHPFWARVVGSKGRWFERRATHKVCLCGRLWRPPSRPQAGRASPWRRPKGSGLPSCHVGR